MPSPSDRLVLVTGGTGYIAAFCIADLLREGWRVRTTARSLGKADAIRRTVGALGVDASAVEVVEADLLSDKGWREATAAARYVLHVASPFPLAAPKSDDELVRPAREGALRVLAAARDAGVKRVVMTSSFVAIGYGRGGRAAPFTEADWSDETNLADTSAYGRSKTIAERAAWAWLKAEGGALELATVNPGLVLGPVPSADLSSSLVVVKRMLDGSFPALPRIAFPCVDVRDVARLHGLAMTSPAAAGERFLAVAEQASFKDIATILRKGLGPDASKVPSLVLPDFAVRLFALFDAETRSNVFELGKERRANSDKARRMLGWTTRPLAESILDAARSLVAEGLV